MAASPAQIDAKVLLLQKEQEVAGLREAALKQLEAQVHDQHGKHGLIALCSDVLLLTRVVHCHALACTCTPS